MKTKTVEIRDLHTCIPALAIQMHSLDRVRFYYLHLCAGYPKDGSGIVLMRLSDQKATVDPYDWPSLTGDVRTMPVAHLWIIEHFDEISDGDVIDVEFILGETAAAKTSERFEVVER
jgi:hypothetical protein